MSPLRRRGNRALRTAMLWLALACPVPQLAAQVTAATSLTDARGDVLLARAANDSSALADALHRLGLVHWRADAYDSALVHLVEARELRIALNDSAGLARVLNSIGSSHYQEGNYGPALESFLRSLEIRRARRDNRGMALNLANIGKTYQDWKQYERAVLEFHAAVNAAEASGDAAVLGYALHSLGVGQIDIGRYDEARRSFARSLEAYSRTGPHRSAIDSTSGWSLVALSLGRLDVLEGRPAQAIVRIDSVLARALKAGTIRGEIESRLALGAARMANREPARALQEYQRALWLGRRAQLRTLQLEALDGLARAEESRGNAQAALRYVREHTALSDSVFDRSTAHRVLAMELEMRAAETMRTNSALLLAQRLQEEALGRQRLVTALSWALLALAAALALVFWRFNHIARRQAEVLAKTNAELGEANEGLRTALAEVRTLSGFIPICAHCKRVRDDDGYWKAVETYISSRSDASFSHAICGSCGPVLYGEDWEGPTVEGPTPGAR